MARAATTTDVFNAIAEPRRREIIGMLSDGREHAVVNRRWHMMQIYRYGYFPLCAVILLLGLLGVLPRVRRSTKGEGTERRYFYGSVWAVTAAQTLLLILWKTLPRTHTTDIIKLILYVAVLIFVGILAARGKLYRTRPILPGEVMVSD